MGTEMISAECIYPAPMMTEIDRQKRLGDFRLNIYANGCVIEKEWRVRNPVFDKREEKTTTMFKIRPAQTEDEVKFLFDTLKGKGE